jgi:hypothetical protein
MTDLDKIIRFLTGIGFRVEREIRDRPTQLPGVFLDGMTIYVELPKLLWPGDILHEAGHMAVIPEVFRPHLSGDVEKSLAPLALEYSVTQQEILLPDGSEDMIQRGLIQCGEPEAQAWSYAAALEAGIDPALVFHADAYEGESESTLLRFSLGQHFGVHGLAAAKMTTIKSYPTMLRWLQV